MVPFYFGASSRRLFGVYHPGAGGKRKGTVLCAPWGQEYLRAHQSLRFLAARISGTGSHVLRFDWYGTGDSDGTGFEGGEPGAWADDLAVAVDELKAMANLTSVSLVGLRLGAVPAAQLARTTKGIHRLVLWDPVMDGAQYAADLLGHPQAKVITGSPNLPADLRTEPVLEVMGFPLTPEMRRGLESCGTSVLGEGLPPTFLLSTVPDPDRYSPVRDALTASGNGWEEEQFGGPEAWVEEDDFGTSGMPVEALRRVAEWLAA